MEQVLHYLSDLQENNNREWFHRNKSRYENARELFLAEVQKTVDQLKLHDHTIFDLKATDAMFRLFRDIRFSKDKTPYKTHFAAFLAREGRKSAGPGYYIHIGNNEMFLAAGVHSPSKEALRAIRLEITYQPEVFTSITKERFQLGYEMYEEDKLKKGPADFPKDSPQIELLKYKHYLLSRNLTREEVLKAGFAERIVGYFIPLVPFNNFLKTAVEYAGNE
jgi:uncharacterized protein (TIGR02453 family)